MEVQFSEPSVIATDDSTTRMRSMFLASQEALRTIEQNLTNRSLLARVVRAEGLADDGGRALLGQSVSKSTSSAPPKPSNSPGEAKTDTVTVAPAFTPLEETLGG